MAAMMTPTKRSERVGLGAAASACWAMPLGPAPPRAGARESNPRLFGAVHPAELLSKPAMPAAPFKKWRVLPAGPPGRRFRNRYYQHQKSARGHGLAARIL